MTNGDYDGKKQQSSAVGLAGVYASGMTRPSVQGCIHSVPRQPTASCAVSRVPQVESEIAGQARNDNGDCNDSINPTDHLKNLRKRDELLRNYIGTNYPQVAMN